MAVYLKWHQARIGNAKVSMSGTVAGYGKVVSLVQTIYSEAKTAADLMQKASYQLELAVMAAPSFSAVKNNGLFKMQFYAPFPFSYLQEEQN